MLPWCQSSVELRALVALAIQAVTPQSPKAEEHVKWLMDHLTGHRWSPDKATGPAALAQGGTILLLDEPTNHLDAESIHWLEQHLDHYPGTVVAVTHDRYFLDNVAKWILELDRGEGHPFEGNYSAWLEQKQERLRVEQKAESDRQRTLARELDWIRASPKARQAVSRSRSRPLHAPAHITTRSAC